MKTNIYRILFFGGLFFFVYEMYILLSLPPHGSAEYLKSSPNETLSLISGIWIIFLIYLTVFAFYHFIFKCSVRRAVWFVILFLPAFGAYIYFEKFIRRDNFDNNPAWKMNPRADCTETEIIRTLQRRSVAAFLDYGIFALFYAVFISCYGQPKDANTIYTTVMVMTFGSKQISGINTLPIILWWFLYFSFAEFIFGQTIGKWIFRVKVVIGDGAKVSFVGAVRRHIFDILDVICFLFVVVRVKSRKILPRRFGDRWGHTWVIMKQPPNQALKLTVGSRVRNSWRAEVRCLIKSFSEWTCFVSCILKVFNAAA